MNKATGQPLVVDHGLVQKELTFVAKQSKGSVFLDFTFNASALQGRQIVAFERLHREGVELAVHADIEDENQTITFKKPEIGTKASNKVDGQKELDPLASITIRDEVMYRQLIPGKTYTIEGTLMDKRENSPLYINGKKVTKRVTFKPSSENGSVFMDFTIPGTAVRGKRLVVFEDLIREDTTLTVHRDLTDIEQTVDITEPEIQTEALNKEDQTHVSDALNQVTIRDEVKYQNLIVGKEYTVSGTLMVKSTNKPLLVNGQPVKQTKTFIAPAKNGSVFLDFTFNASALQGETVVAFEKLHREGTELAVHEEIKDREQSIDFPNPSIGTWAVNKADHTQVLDPLDEITIRDYVKYENLIVGKTYTIKGKLMDKATNRPLLIDGKEITQEVTFQPTKSNHYAVLDYTLSGKAVRGKELVVFEQLIRQGTILERHEDIKDEGQTVRITNPEVGTKAFTREDGTQISDALQRVQVRDKVEYKDLIPGKSYEMTGTLMLKSNGQPLMYQGQLVQTTKTFVPTSPNGHVYLDFTFDARGLQGDAVVAFEKLHREGSELALHADLKDKGQTVDINRPEVKTFASNKEDGLQLIDPLEEITIRDEVKYTNLLLGKEYIVRGWLMDKASGKKLMQNGKAIKQELRFKPESSNGSVFMDYTLDGRLVRGKELVVFEELWRGQHFTSSKVTDYEDQFGLNHDYQSENFYKETLLADHKDLEDKHQTVYVTDPKVRTVASNLEDQSSMIDALKQVTIRDEIYFEDVIPGKTYLFDGHLMRRSTGKPLMVNGEMVKQAFNFAAPGRNGSIFLDYTFNAEGLQGETLVSYAYLNRQGQELASHEDINHTGQSTFVNNPSLQTKASNPEDGSKEFNPLETITIQDEVTYKNLIVGKTYTIKGTLMDKGTNSPVMIGGEKVTSEVTFKAPSRSGKIYLNFVLPSETVRGKEIVVFEDLHRENTELAIHHDIKDENQTVYVANPEIGTTATVEGSHLVDALNKVVLEDEVQYKDLIVGKEYTVKGQLMVKSTGQPLRQNGQIVSAQKTFVATSKEGRVVLEFHFNAADLQGEEVVAFERLYYQGDLMADHEDIEDLGQSVRFNDAEIKTHAHNRQTGEQQFLPLSKITITDEVTYEGLTAGKTYTMTGWLMDKETGRELLIDGQKVQQQVEFTPESTSGSVFLDFVIDARHLAGKTLVAFETLSREGTELAIHHDIKDEKQTVEITKPEMGTLAYVGKDKAKVVPATGEVTITDEVRYQGLVPGLEYELTGWLMRQSTEEPFLVNGEKLMSHKTFAPTASEGVVNMEFVIPDASLVGNDTLVAFEELRQNGELIAEHKDIHDESQSVRFVEVPKGRPRLPQTGRWMFPVYPFATAFMVPGIILWVRKRRG